MNEYDKNMVDPADDEYLFMEETIYIPERYDPDPDLKDIKTVVGEAIGSVPGVLALKGGLTDIFKKGEDLTRGISVQKEDGHVNVSAKVITDSNYDNQELIQQMTDAITDNLQMQMGLIADDIYVEIAETMTESEFYKKYDADRALH